jgi:hypothetical protein
MPIRSRALALLLPLALTAGACSETEEAQVEEVGETLEATAEKAVEATEDAADRLGEAVEDATEEVRGDADTTVVRDTTPR